MTVDTTILVRDLMRTPVHTLATTMPVREAIETLEANELNGAPVVDRADRLVGFLSLRDIARSEHVRDERIDTERREHLFTQSLEEMGEDEPLTEDILDKEDYSPEVLGAETVQDWMNPQIISIRPDASLRDVCRLMVAEGVHRVLVVQRGKLEGIVSTFDIVRHFADRASEQ
jgi:predicted transcriptional regulator